MGPHLGLELTLGGLEESLDEASRGGVPGGTVKEAGMNPIAGGFEAIGVVDFGIIEVEL